MTSSLDVSKKKLDTALHKLEYLIQSIVERPRSATGNGATQHLKELNNQLQKENIILKEQLFLELKNMNALKESNKTAHAEIEKLITKLESMLN